MKKILLYGNSLWFDGLATYLPNLAECHVTRLNPTDWENLPAVSEATLIVVDQTLEMHALGLMRRYPTAMLISIDITTGKLTVLQGQTLHVTSIQELAHLMRGVTVARTNPVLLAPPTSQV